MKPIDILALLNVPSVGKKTVGAILSKYEHVSISTGLELYEILEEMAIHSSRIKVPSKDDFIRIYNHADSIIDISLDNGITPLGVNHKKFPDRLKDIPDAPVLLYAKGNLDSLNSERAVAIIGTRDPTDFGMKAGERLASIFTKNDFVVVSGLAIGCDTAGHLGCLNENGITVAVLAGSLEKIYPKENRGLAIEILEKNGCLISEYAFDVAPQKTFFVERDRLQSGLSQAVVVIETDVKGGTMHTVGFSIKQGRYLACLGGHPPKYNHHPKIQGNLMLIRERKASILSSLSEINNFIELVSKPKLSVDDIFSSKNLSLYENTDVKSDDNSLRDKSIDEAKEVIPVDNSNTLSDTSNDSNDESKLLTNGNIDSNLDELVDNSAEPVVKNKYKITKKKSVTKKETINKIPKKKKDVEIKVGEKKIDQIKIPFDDSNI